jgi:hypothetical protein
MMMMRANATVAGGVEKVYVGDRGILLGRMIACVGMLCPVVEVVEAVVGHLVVAADTVQRKKYQKECTALGM